MDHLKDVHKATHYNSHPSGIEVRQVTDHMCFNIGSAFKYVMRRDAKGTAIKDLLKAIEYIDYQLQVGPPPPLSDACLMAWNQILEHEPDIIVRRILQNLGVFHQLGGRSIAEMAQHQIKTLLMQTYGYEFTGTKKTS